MAAKTFGALVQEVLLNIQQDGSDATSIHAHRARRYLMRTMRKLRMEEFHFTQADGQLQSTAGRYEYGLAANLSANVRRVTNVWYANSTTSELIPSLGDTSIYEDNRIDAGVPQRDWNVIIERVRRDTTNQNYIDSWAWYQHKLWVAPRLDGEVYIVVRYVEQPIVFEYSRVGGAWTYFTQDAQGNETTHDGTKIDDQTDSTGWLENAYDLIVTQTTRDLFLGPYQAKDPKGVRSEQWIAMTNEERDALAREEKLGQGVKRAHPYMMPV